MNSAKKFFEDNINRLGPASHSSSPLEHNLNRGLLALSEEVAQLRSELAAVSQQLLEVKQALNRR